MSSRQPTNRDNRNLVRDIKNDQQQKQDALDKLATVEYSKLKFVHTTSLLVNAEAITNGVVFTSINVRNFLNAPTAKAILFTFWTSGSIGSTGDVFIDSSDVTPGDYSWRYHWHFESAVGRQLSSLTGIVELGADGKIKILPNGFTPTVNVSVQGYFE